MNELLEDSKKKPLLVFSASAGSGKTYTLVKTYLSLILKGNLSPNYFSKIMAMTFTNKAALEMKSRIIEALDDLSKPERITKSIEEKVKAKEYLTKLANEFSLSEKELSQRAQNALTGILHQFEDFNVMTIDKFNLKLIRSFAMDLNLDGNFKVVINEDDINQRVIDEILGDIDKDFSSVYSKITFDLATQRLKDKSVWNFEKDLMNYAEILKNEKNISLLNQIDMGNITSHNIDSQINTINQNIIFQFDKYLSNLQPYIDKLPFGRSNNAFLKRLNAFKSQSLSEWKGLFTSAMITKFTEPNGDAVMEITARFYEIFLSEMGKLEELEKTRKSYYYILLLKKIQERLQNFRKEEQIIRISEFNQMISDLLKKENSLFIYEKLGTHFNHYLLDEFQDTSRLQWLNIIPLMHESLSHGYSNLIVGDAKQSIYRFRGGVVEQFVALPKIFNPDNEDNLAQVSKYFYESGRKVPLDDNYRSTKDIVEFNNSFFQNFVSFLSEAKDQDFSEVYVDIKQGVKKQQSGLVEIISSSSPKKSVCGEDEDNNEDDDNATNSSRTFLLQKVGECLEDGYHPGDICVLGSTARLCNQFALTLTEHQYKVVSVDSLSVNSDAYVKLCISYLKWRYQPMNVLSAKIFMEKYLTIKYSDEASAHYISYIDNENNRYIDYQKFITDYFKDWDSFFSPFENIYSLLNKFYQMATINELNNPYLHHLSDLAFMFDLNNGPDLVSFLNYYENEGKKSSIQSPENEGSIRIMTAHKSKGLQFKIVIIPQLNDTFLNTRKLNYLIKIKEPISNTDRLIYTNVSNNFISQELQKQYNQEYHASLLDKLNLYYVAFTRAIDRLYVMNEVKQESSTSFGVLFHQFLHETNDFTSNYAISVTEQTKDTTKKDSNKQYDQLELVTGERVKQNSSMEDDTILSNEFKPLNINDKLWFPSISLRHKLTEFDEDINAQIRYGKQLHEVLSVLENFENEQSAINYLLRKGRIEHTFEQRILENVSKIKNNETYIQLFKDALQVINEQSIIISENEIRRPDKVIVKENETIVLDYKSGMESSKYIKQVQQYCSILEQTGFKNVKGLILYTQDLKFVRVN